MSEIGYALKEVFLSFYPSRSFIEGMIKYDFKIGDRRSALMQVCFSNLAFWPLLILLVIVYVDPFKASWSLVSLLSYENVFVLFLLDGRLTAMLTIFLSFYFLEWIFRKEYLFVFLIFYFLNRSELHINNALMAVMGVYLSRICYMWWMGIENKSKTRKIWNSVQLIQIFSWLLTIVGAVLILDYIQINFLFASDRVFSRFVFLAAVIVFYHIFCHFILSIWGHFYFKIKIEPSDIPIYFSTALWILRFNMSFYLLKLLKDKISDQLPKHEGLLRDYEEIRPLKGITASENLAAVITKEIGYLKEANLRLTKI